MQEALYTDIEKSKTLPDSSIKMIWRTDAMWKEWAQAKKGIAKLTSGKKAQSRKQYESGWVRRYALRISGSDKSIQIS